MPPFSYSHFLVKSSDSAVRLQTSAQIYCRLLDMFRVSVCACYIKFEKGTRMHFGVRWVSQFPILFFTATKQCAVWSNRILFQHLANPFTYLGNCTSLACSWDDCLLINMVTGARRRAGSSLIGSVNRKIPQRREQKSFGSHNILLFCLYEIIRS